MSHLCFLHTADNWSLNSYILQLYRDSLFQTGCEGQERAPVSHSWGWSSAAPSSRLTAAPEFYIQNAPSTFTQHALLSRKALPHTHTHTFIYKKPLIILCSCSSHRLFLLHVVFFVLLVCSLLFIILFLSLLNRRFPSLFFPSLYIFFQISRSLPALGWFFWADTETVRFNPQTDGLIRRQMLLQLRSRAWWETSTSQTLLQLSLLSSFLDVFF